ncbi:MAG TPA: deoxyribonuclease IV [Lacipirellulaceae bacterium]|nr:deoxyribonuclease IV [Lacipirellulaceae bacterium]
MPPLGAHQSIAGGYYKAVEIARRTGCACVQVFTKNNNQWRAKPITCEEAQKFRATLAELGITHPLAHDSYLINLGSPDDELWNKSIDAFVVELERADQLGIPYVVAHPGSYTTSNEAAGLARIIAALDQVHERCPTVQARCLLENTAGQGSNLGWRFEHLAAILEGVREPHRLGGVCLDTCHLFAAGYAISTARQFKATLREFDAVVGVHRIKAFHLNDSKTKFGSRVDRHAAIGRGEIGLEAFRTLLNDRRFRSTPMYLETHKGIEDGQELDVINLNVLRGLLRAQRKTTKV